MEEGMRTRPFWLAVDRWKVVAVLTLASASAVAGAGCSDPGSAEQGISASKQTLGGPTEPEDQSRVKGWSRAEAAADLANRARFTARGTTTGYLLEATSGALAIKAPASESFEGTLRRFVADYGVLLMAKGEKVPTAPITLVSVAGPVPFRSGGDEGNYVMLSQQVDGFAVHNVLIAGRFVGESLHKVSGRLFDPELSPTRAKPLACSEASGARTRFVERHPELGFLDSWNPTGQIDFTTGRVFWRSGQWRLDAANCEWLPDTLRPTEDPSSVFNLGKKP